MPCNQICEKPEHRFTRTGKQPFYSNGGSRCNGRCQCFLKYDGLFCPCCGVRLRKNPRGKNRRIDYRDNTRID